MGLGKSRRTGRIEAGDPRPARAATRGPRPDRPPTRRNSVTFQTSAPQTEMRPSAVVGANYLAQAFLWMFAGLFLTAVVTAVTYNSETVMTSVARAWLPIVIVQFGLVLAIQFLIPRISATASLGLFFIYAASLGFTTAV